ncbi:hypothetical protein [Erwinia amylovora]
MAVSYTHLDVYKRQAERFLHVHRQNSHLERCQRRGPDNACLLYTSRCV